MLIVGTRQGLCKQGAWLTTMLIDYVNIMPLAASLRHPKFKNPFLREALTPKP